MEQSIKILYDELVKEFKSFLRNFAFYGSIQRNGTLQEYLQSFINHINRDVDGTWILRDAMDNDHEPDAPQEDAGIRQHCNQIQNMLNIGVAIHTLNNNGQNTQYIVDGFNTIKNELTQRNLWLNN
jgi:hypothetical protein